MTMRDPREGRPGAPSGSSSFGMGASAGTQGPVTSGTAPDGAGAAGADAGNTGGGTDQPQGVSSLLPALTVPKGGGAIRGIGEKFSVNAATGTASLGVPLAVSPGRAGFAPEVALSYDSGGGNGPFGLGFNLSVPTISRKSDKGLPRYYDEEESDQYVLSGAEDLVPTRNADGSLLELVRNLGTTAYRVRRYRPRAEGLFANIERWIKNAPGDPTDHDVHWRVITPDNVTNVYGRDPTARITDPADRRRVFTWFLEETRDEKGNVVRYVYKGEDGKGVVATKPSEKSRFDHSSDPPLFSATAQRYLKRVFYGNRAPFLPAAGVATTAADFLFELVFDYGEHGALPSPVSAPGTLASFPTPDDDADDWSVRVDPFSTYRAGFEVRTYRLCQRVLMFHRFEATPLLVRSTDFEHEPNPSFTYLVGITQAGYLNDASTGNAPFRDVLPTLRLDYRRPVLNDALSVLPKESLEGLEGGVDGTRKQWVDLDGEGIPGVLIDSDYAWYYKSNRGSAKLESPRVLSSMPSPATLAGGVQQLEDLAGDGQLDLVSYASPLAGYFTRTTEGTFESLRNFLDLPNIDFRDPNLRFLDADGDGLPDILITEDHAVVWYRSKGKGGFDAAERVASPSDDELGPAVVFSDPEQTIQFADMSGDGLVDIVRIRNGEVSYWPNLGHGRFGKKVTLENSPTFDLFDRFDARRVRFGDVDGSGTSDIFYLGASGTTLYRNESGNRLATGERITALPPVDNVATLTVTDLLGTGTATLVWSSPLPGARTLFYVDLMGGKKPHLLEKVENNLGAETRLTYAPSTKFYLEDKAAGTPWLTRLAFPVHVVERAEHFDHVSRSRLVSSYRYAHGFFDGLEREFRGFARVEQRDAEEFTVGAETELFQAPVKTVTWFHTGAWLEKERLESALAIEYFPPGPKTPADLALLVRDTHFEADGLGEPLTIQDEREAARALRGAMLRREIYAEDADVTGDADKAKRPYLVTEQNFSVRRLQSSSSGKHGVFLSFPRESLAIHTERNPNDPRIAHDFVLDVDPYGNVTRKASITYSRADVPARVEPEQTIVWATLTEARFANRPSPDTTTNIAEDQRWHRIGVEYETRVSELTGLPPFTEPAQRIHRFETIDGEVDDLLTSLDASNDLPFEDDSPATTFLRRRTIGLRQQLFYDKNTLTTTLSPLGLGVIDSLALPYESYQLALTTGLANFLANQASLLTGVATSSSALAAILIDGGKYVQRDAHFWTRSGRLVFEPTRFHLAVRAIDPFLDPTDPAAHYQITYDAFSLLALDSRDPLGNLVSVDNDYRVLAPRRVTDPNLNRVEVAFDALGQVTRSAVQGKASESLGDSLQFPTTLLEYQKLRWQVEGKPVFVKSTTRELHVSQAAETAFQRSFAYSDGLGRVVMNKIQAEPGEVPGSGFTDPRWVGTGRTIFNNKGRPIKQYEPFFSATSDFEAEASIVEVGVTSILHYDPLGRVIRTEFPDGSESRVEFDAWLEQRFDQNDAVEGTRWLTEHQSGTADEQLAALRALAHAGTPTLVHLDTLGRPFLVRTDNGPPPGDPNGPHRFHDTRNALDVEGNVREVLDAIANVTVRQRFDVLGRKIHSESPDSGTRLLLADVAGKPLRTWDSRTQTVRPGYDLLQRQTHLYVRRGTDTERLLLRTVHGESLDAPGAPTPTPAQQQNLRGRVHHGYDCAGLVINVTYDFKGNLLQAARRLAFDYQTEPDWKAAEGAGLPSVLLGLVETLLEDESFDVSTTYDALNRVRTRTTDDGSIAIPKYNEAGLLEQLRVRVRSGAERLVIADIDYNARGQRILCVYVDPTNAAETVISSIEYRYDPETFRLAELETTSGATTLQHFVYTYDPVGNVVAVRNQADTAPFFNGSVVSGDAFYEYDAVYQLIGATGREHPGIEPVAFEPDPGDSLPHPNDTQALSPYSETYEYDEVGNILRIQHTGVAGWTRNYAYFAGTNRLQFTSVPGSPLNVTAPYTYDPHGSMSSMPHLVLLEWDYADRLKHTQKTNGDVQDTYFTYDAGGARIRKVFVTAASIKERIYLGGYEIYRERVNTVGSAAEFERQTLHVVDDQRRIAMVETKTREDDEDVPDPISLWRFQLESPQGSTLAELDHDGIAISYEEYHPYGSTAFHAARSAAGVSTKRYRYTGKERDEETGLYYHGARYYAPWLGRWILVDPAGMVDGTNRYQYCRGNPITRSDRSGTQSTDPDKDKNKSPSFGQQLKQLASNVQVSGNVTVKATIPPQTETLKLGPLTLSGATAKGEVKVAGRFSLFNLESISIHEAAFKANVRASADVALPDFGLEGRTYFNVDALHLELRDNVATAGISADARFVEGPLELSLKLRADLAGAIDERIYFKNLAEHGERLLSGARGDFRAVGRLSLFGGEVGRIGISGRFTEPLGGDVTVRGGLTLGYEFLHLSGSGTFSGNRFDVAGSFSGILPGAATTGTFSYSSSSGLAAQGHYVGPLLPGLNGLGVPINPTGLEEPAHYAVPDGPNEGPVHVLEPSVGIGYTYFNLSPRGTTLFSAGATFGSEYVPYYQGGTSQPFSGPSGGPYFGARFSTSF